MLTPLSLLINITTVMVCTLVIHPNLGTTCTIDVDTGAVSELFCAGDIAQLYPTAISPLPSMIAVYLVALYLAQVGYCVLLVVARNRETKVSRQGRSSDREADRRSALDHACTRRRAASRVRKLFVSCMGHCLGKLHRVAFLVQRR